jgi:hypothetical protein
MFGKDKCYAYDCSVSFDWYIFEIHCIGYPIV